MFAFQEKHLDLLLDKAELANGDLEWVTKFMVQLFVMRCITAMHLKGIVLWL